MQNRFARSAAAAIFAVFIISSLALAQRGAPVAGPPHDPHDLGGIWLAGGGGARSTGPQPDARGFLADGGLMTEWGPSSPLTPAGLKAVNSNISGKGPRGVAPVYANDPIGEANPPGLLRELVYGRPFQLIHTPDKLVQIFEWTRVWREIWTEREMPQDIDRFWGRWLGYSVGKWDGNTFVVDTVGLDAREWLDMYGDPFSDQLRLTERWRRLDRDRLELVLNINDPGTYTKPWSTVPKIFRLQQKGSANGELQEVIFAPMDEKDFNDKIRDPAGKP